MGKEEKDMRLVKEVHKRESKLVDFRYQNRVKHINNANNYNKSLDDWARKGFVGNTLDKGKMDTLVNLEKKMNDVNNNLYTRKNNATMSPLP